MQIKEVEALYLILPDIEVKTIEDRELELLSLMLELAVKLVEIFKMEDADLTTDAKTFIALVESKLLEARLVIMPKADIELEISRLDEPANLVFATLFKLLEADVAQTPRFISVPAYTFVGLHTKLVEALYFIFPKELKVLMFIRDKLPLNVIFAVPLSVLVETNAEIADLFIEANAAKVLIT